MRKERWQAGLIQGGANAVVGVCQRIWATVDTTVHQPPVSALPQPLATVRWKLSAAAVPPVPPDVGVVVAFPENFTACAD